MMYFRRKLLTICLILPVIVCCIQESSARKKQIDCRKMVHAPICRGIAAKRDTGPLLESNRYPSTPQQETEAADYSYEVEKIPQDSMYTVKNLLTELMRSKNLEYESNGGQTYLS